MIRATELAQGPRNVLHVSVIEDARAWPLLRREWSALLDRSDASLFNAWEWLEPWHRLLGFNRTLHLLVARDGSGALVGLMPLSMEKRHVAGREIRRLGFLGETHVGSDYLDLIAEPGDRVIVAELFAHHLLRHRDRWDLLELNDVDERSETLDVFRHVFAQDPFRMRFDLRCICPWEPFAPGDTFDAFLRRTGRRLNYLRRRRWLQSQPGFAVERAETRETVQLALDDFFRLHALRWKSAGGSLGITGPSVERFHREALTELADAGHVRLYTLKVGGAAVASVYGLVHNDTFLYYQSGYDPAWRDRSVGLVLVGETFADALASGMRGFDFLRGVEPYKAEWTTQQKFTLGMRVWREGGVGDWLVRREDRKARTRAWVRDVLPPAVLESVRRARAWVLR